MDAKRGQIKGLMIKECIMMLKCKLKGALDGLKMEGIMMCKLRGGCKRWHYDVQIKRADG